MERTATISSRNTAYLDSLNENNIESQRENAYIIGTRANGSFFEYKRFYLKYGRNPIT
jgi:hypothetical protein